MEMITEAVAQLHLELVDEEWVKEIADSEYLQIAEMPPIYESVLSDINVSVVLGNIIESVTLWLQDGNTREQRNSWTYLKKKIKLKKLLALLCYFMKRGTKDVLVKEYRDTAILAARLYFNFMFISGYIAHNVYHSQIFVYSLACLTYPRLLLELHKAETIIQEVNVLLLQINEYVTEMQRVIVTLNLQPGDVNYDNILECLLEVAGGSVATRRGVDQVQCVTITAAVYEMIEVMIKDVEGRPCAAAITHLFSTMLPKLLTMCTVHSASNLAQHNFISFIALLISRYKEYTVQALYILLQHLCYRQDLLDRNDVRSSRASLVLSLMPQLPKTSYCKFVNWLIEMTSYSHVVHRNMALEVLGGVLEQTYYESLQELEESQESGISSDANVSDSGESGQNVDNNMVVATVRRNSSSGIENQEVEEDSNINNQQTIQQLYAELLATLEQCIEDANYGVRVRALSLFTQCIASRRAQIRIATEVFDKTGTGNRLMSIAMVMTSDERATVKRAALDMLLELVNKGDTDEESLKMLVTLCRDTSIQVRAATISALTGLCKSNPNPAVMDAFVSGPLHQLSDSEVKIQDQVVLAVKHLIIDNLKPYERTETNSKAWMLMEAITNRSKRKYLDIACTMMLKYKSFNKKLVDILSTHIGKYDPTHRSLHALVLLSCAGKHITYNNVMFLIKHFYDVGNSERNDVREIELSLELLTAWSHHIAESQRTQLRSFIISGVENGTLGNNGSGPYCLTFARLLDQDNLQWASENMNTLVQGADDNTPALQLEKLSDVSLLSTTNPPYRLIKQMIRKLTHTDLDSKSRGIVVISIARLCVRSYPHCRRVAAAFGEILLQRDGPLQPRVNALSALEDICSRHSGIVEPLMNTICTCLEKEAPVLLRRKAARCITMLLLNQFLKLQTPLYYSYCALAMDSDTEVRELCLNYVMCRLDPKVILNCFVDGVLYYNNSGPHASDNYSNYIDEATRRKLYDLLLSRLTNPQRHQVLCRLGRQVLGYAVELCDEQTAVEDSLTELMESAIHDAIILITQLLVLKTRRGKAATTEVLDEEDDLGEQPTEYSAMSPKVRRAIADSLIPGVVNLHSRIITAHSFLVDPLTRLGKDLLRYFKNEVDEYLTKGDILSEQIKQFRKNAEKATNRAAPSKASVHSRPRKDSEPTAGPSRSRTRTESSGPSRKRTSSEFREAPSGLPGCSESVEPIPGPSRRTSSEFRDPPSEPPGNTGSVEPIPGSSRKRISSEFRDPPTTSIGTSENEYIAPGPSKRKTSSEFRDPPSRSSEINKCNGPTPGLSRKWTSSEFRDPPFHSPGTINYLNPTPGTSKGTSSEFEHNGPTPGLSRKWTSSDFRKPPSRSPGRREYFEPTPGPSRRTSSEFRDPPFGSSGTINYLNPTPGTSKGTSSEFSKPPSKSPGLSEHNGPTPGTSRKWSSSEFSKPPSRSPGSSEYS